MKTVLIGVNSSYVHTNLAIRSLAASLKETDFVLKEFNINQHMHHVLEELLREKPDVAAFSCYIWNISFVLRLAEDIKMLIPNIKIVLGGPEVSFETKQLMEQFSFIDYVIQGEGEEVLERFLDCLNKERELDIKGILHRKNHQILGDAQYLHVKDITKIAKPFALLQEEYNSNKIYYYESSRGCPYRCAYCLSGVEGGGLREKPVKQVMEELDIFVGRGVRLVKFTDRTFNANRKRAYAIWDYILNQTENTCFHFEVGLDLLDTELLELLKKMPSGKIQLEAGIQSCNERTLEAVCRKTDIEKALGFAKQLIEIKNIPLHLDLIAGLPMEGLASFGDSFNQVFLLFPNRLQLGFLKLLKGSALREQLDEYGIVHRKYPPYEVLFTNDISAAELLALKNVEELLNRYYNTGRVLRALRYLVEQCGIAPFKFFWQFYLYCEAEGSMTRPVSVQAQFELLTNFCSTLLDKEQYENFIEQAYADYVSIKAKGKVPSAFVQRAEG